VRAVFEELMHDWGSDPAAALARRSALCRPEELRVPILLLHGREDRRVPVSQAERLADALRSYRHEVGAFVSLALPEPMLAKQTPNDQVRKRPENAQLPDARESPTLASHEVSTAPAHPLIGSSNPTRPFAAGSEWAEPDIAQTT